MPDEANPLTSWNDTPSKAAIVEFIESVAENVPDEERVAVFDNDGTLWCEKPMPIELGFILKRLAEMVNNDDSLRARQPWKAASSLTSNGWAESSPSTTPGMTAT